LLRQRPLQYRRRMRRMRRLQLLLLWWLFYPLLA
jgi:hypothetical protein